MAGRQRATFQKRQKEVKRLEKQRMKAEKRAARRQEKTQRPLPPHPMSDGEPEIHDPNQFPTPV